ncbi:multi-sensor hybrid histidine kinase [Calothrix sp. NIES-4101]|nr:multi-sensor hybrid histidine kinase [Calothrix sp. NIES-4101]
MTDANASNANFSRQQLSGVVTESSILQVLPPANLLKMRLVGDVMNTQVIYAFPTASILDVTRLMADNNTSCVVIIKEEVANEKSLIPIGIITEQDIVQFQALGGNLAEITAVSVINKPLFCLTPVDSLWFAHQQMQARKLGQLVIVGNQGELLGILTQSSFWQLFDPVEMINMIAELQQNIANQAAEVSQLYQQLHQEKSDRQKLAAKLQEKSEELERIAATNAHLQGEINEHKRTEAILRQSEARFRALSETSPDIITLCDPQANVFYQSPSVERTLGYLPAEFLGHQPLTSVHPDDLANIQAIMANMLAKPGIPLVLEYRLRHKNGSWVWLECVATNCLHDDDIGAFLFLSRDITQRKRTEAALRDSEERYRSVIKAIREGIVVHDAEGRIITCNASAERILGLTKDQIMGRTSQDSRWQTIHEDGSPFANDSHPAIVTLRTGTPCLNVVMGVYKPNGELSWILINSEPLFPSGEMTPYAVVVSFSDISRRKEAEVALRKSELSYRTLAENLPAIVYRKFPNVNNSMVFFNNMVETMFGYKTEDLCVGEICSINSLIIPEDREKIATTVQDAIAKHQPFQIAYRLYDQDGAIRYCWEQGRPIHNPDGELLHIDGVIFDITKSKQAEAKIYEQAALLNIATDAICVRDLENSVLFWNQGAENLYGFSADEILGKNANELLHKDSNLLEMAIQTTIASGYWQGEFTNLRKDGKEVIVASSWTLMRDETGNPKSILTVNTNITEKKQLEQQFYRAQRLESLGTLAGGIAHDLNNILTPILAVSQLLPLKLTNLDDRMIELLKMQETNAKRAADLVKQILSFARGAEGKRIAIQIKYLLTEIESIARGTFPKSIAIETQLPDDLGIVIADATQLHQIFMNLVVNARDAILNEGKITIAAENFYVDDYYAKMNIEAKVGDYILVTITDTGVGIAPEIIDRIFEPFFTTKDVGKGTGLGLSTTIGIVKNHGGFVNVSSQLGKGSRFQVYLPASNSCISPTLEQWKLPVGKGELILVADDETVIAETTKSTLENYNYRVLKASDGIDAIATYVQNKNEINLVLIDMMMPLMDGENTIRTLQRLNPQVQIIAMSGLGSPQMVEKAARHGVMQFLLKPFTAKELLTSLHSVLSGGTSNS